MQSQRNIAGHGGLSDIERMWLGSLGGTIRIDHTKIGQMPRGARYIFAIFVEFDRGTL